MKIGFLIQPWDNASPPDLGGSIGRSTWEVARRLAHSCEVLVCGPRHHGQPPAERRERVQFARIPLKPDRPLLSLMRRLPHLSGARRIPAGSGLYYGAYAMRAARIMRDRRCGVIHVHNFSQFVPIVRWFNPRSKIVLHMHCDWLVQLERRTIGRRLGHADMIIGNSDYVTAGIRRRFPGDADRCLTVFNGVDVNAFSPAGNGIRDSNGACIVYVGRISPEKGLHVLLDAFEQVLARRPDARLRIVGGAQVVPKEFIVDLSDDPEVRNLGRFYGGENYIDFLRKRVRGPLQGRVSFEGELRHEAVAKLLPGASVLVLPSLVETFGMPAAEAMAAGIPVVASRIGGLPEVVVEGKTGLLAKANSPIALAQALLRVLDDPAMAQAMGQAGRQRVEQLFSWESIAGGLSRHYAELCGYAADARGGAEGPAGNSIARGNASPRPPTTAGPD
jgi:glycosyltransferase involved in cell wall biosynthesis